MNFGNYLSKFANELENPEAPNRKGLHVQFLKSSSFTNR